jgi:hypothetical protein
LGITSPGAASSSSWSRKILNEREEVVIDGSLGNGIDGEKELESGRISALNGAGP